jgi:hypothetical protein
LFLDSLDKEGMDQPWMGTWYRWNPYGAESKTATTNDGKTHMQPKLILNGRRIPNSTVLGVVLADARELLKGGRK